MPKIVHNALTPVAVKARIDRGEVGRFADGGGLYLHVTGKDQAKWSLRFMVDGRAREMGLGSVQRGTGAAAKGVSLAQARIKAAAVRVKLDAGIDPLSEKEAEEAARRAERAAAEAAALAVSPDRTFKAAFEGWMVDHGPAMKTERQRVLARGLMTRHVFPAIGEKPITGITTLDMAAVLRPIWRTKAETALRVRIRCEAVFAWAKAKGWRQGDNPAIWKENLAPLLGKQGGAAEAQHHRALHWRDVPAFMRRLETDTSMSARALQWAILTAARTGEVIGATWSEIDLEALGGPLWIIPALRMKMKREHRVPLTNAAVAILEAVRPLRDPQAPGGGFLFPGRAGSLGGRIAGGREGAVGGGLSQMALLELLRRLRASKDTTVHGFRSAFRDWAAECTSTPEAVAEAALAHAVGSKTKRAYHRTDLLERRRELMVGWDEHCARKPADVRSLAAERGRRAKA